MRKTPLRPGRLYFFPAILPLVELVPWLLTVIGTLAGVAGLSGASFWNKRKKTVILFSILCFLAVGAIIIYAMPDREVSQAGTRLVDKEKFPAAEILGQAPDPAARTAISFGEIWTIPTKKQVLSTPVVAEKLLLYGSLNNSVEAVSLQNGQPAWSLPQNAPIFSLTAGENGIIYAGEGLHQTQSASLTAIQPDNGAVLWRREFLGHVEEAITSRPEKNHLWLGTGPGGVWSINIDDAKVAWHRPLGHVDSEPLEHEGVLYVPAQISEDRHETQFFALDSKNGETLWSLPQPGQPWGSPLMSRDNKTILTSTGIGQIGINKESDKGWAQGISIDGKLRWQVDLPGTPMQPMSHVQEAGIVIHTTKSGHLVALNTDSGATVWQAKVGNDIRSPATLIEGFNIPLLAVTTYDGFLSIRNALTGDEILRRQVGKFSSSSPVFQAGVLYVASAHAITAFGGLNTLVEE